MKIYNDNRILKNACPGDRKTVIQSGNEGFSSVLKEVMANNTARRTQAQNAVRKRISINQSDRTVIMKKTFVRKTISGPEEARTVLSSLDRNIKKVRFWIKKIFNLNRSKPKETPTTVCGIRG
jgi:hypothetical protein